MENFTPTTDGPNQYARLFFLFWIVSLGASVAFRNLDDPAYKAHLDQWHQERILSLKKETGWLNLAGLFWLNEGANTVGGPGNDVVFPGKITTRLGLFQLRTGLVQFSPASGAKVLADGKPVQEPLTIFSPEQDRPVTLQYGSLRWFVIKRGPKYGIRLRDLESPLLTDFKGIDRFPVDESWRVKAHLEAPTSPKTIPIMDVLGLISQQPLAGTLVFDVQGKTIKLDAVGEGKNLFVMFADETNSHDTYGAGRFLYVDKPDAEGNTVVDFNQAINPPCAFTPYATCPLPPKQNRLALRVTAGEKRAGHP
jgi:uncharacterized protein